MRYALRLSLPVFLILLVQGCAALNSLTNTFDDSTVPEAEAATVLSQNYLTVAAYRKHGLGAAEDFIGNLKWKTKLPAGRYRLAVSIDNPGVGRSFVPVSLTLVAEPGKSYWVAYQSQLGSWSPFVSETEPAGFYGLLEFWKK